MDENLKDIKNSENPNYLWAILMMLLIFGYTGNNWYRNRFEEEEKNDD